jgi:prepilin-type N-terminal cleavage/methylation domain-containing protein
MKKAFTLIELLIVVAIIAILAAIAVPNFLEAQTRSKVARTKADLRTVATALESYAVDTNHYPPTTWNPTNGTWPLEERWKVLPGILSSPIAYISSDTPMRDVFRAAHHLTTELANEVMYLPSEFYKPPYSATDASFGPQVGRYGMWVLRSAGPDTYYQNYLWMHGDYDNGGWNLASYDPTNGTISGGDIYRSQKSTSEAHQ